MHDKIQSNLCRPTTILNVIHNVGKLIDLYYGTQMEVGYIYLKFKDHRQSKV